MNRRTQDILFTLLVIAAIGAAVSDAQKWDLKAALFPRAVGFPVLALLAALLVKQSLGLLKAGQVETTVGETHAVDPEAGQAETTVGETDAVDPVVARRRFFSIVAWILGFFAAIWVLGFPAGGTLSTLAYLRLSAKEKWPISLYISGGTALFFDAMIQFMNIPFFKGTLFERLADAGFESPSVSIVRPLVQVLGLLFGGITQIFAR